MHPERSVCNTMIDTKAYILEEAYRLFLTKGYEGVSISDISKAIGLTKGALYHHFLNKEELFKAVIDKYLRITRLGDLPFDVSLAEYLRANAAHARQIVNALHMEIPQFVPANYLSLLIDAVRHYPGYDTDNLELFRQETNRIRQVLDHAIKTGEIRADIDTHIVSLNLFSISVGIATNLFRRQTPEAAMDAYQAQLNEFYKLLKKP